MSNSVYREGVYGRLYDLGASDESFRRGYVDEVEIQKKIGIPELKDLAPFFDMDDEVRRDKVMDMLDVSGNIQYSYSAGRISDADGHSFVNYALTTSYEQAVLGIPDAFKPDIAPKSLRKVEAGRNMFLSAVMATSYHLRTDQPGVVITTDSYALKHKDKSLICIDSGIYTLRGCEGESVSVPALEAGDEGPSIFIPNRIQHERVLGKRKRMDIDLAFRAIALANSDDEGESVLLSEDLIKRVEIVLDMMQGKRRLVV